jgi:SAM-dependent methyltransferase
VDPAYAQAYRTLYRTHWWWRARERLLLRLLRSYLGPERRHRILDIGCGSGLFFDALDRFGDVEGVETDAGMKTGVSSIDARIHWGPLETFESPHRFSAVLMLDVLEHLEDPETTLRKAWQLLEPGGVVVVTVPAFRLLWTRHDDINQHVMRYTRHTLGALAERAGIRPERLQYFFHWLFPVKLAVRGIEQVAPRRTASSAIPTTPPAPINAACYSLSRVEQAFFTRLSLPFGSSLLMVARQKSGNTV